MAPEVTAPDFTLWIVLAAVPLLLATATAFTKSSIVLAALRIGLSAETLIPWGAVLAIALVVTAVIMGPTVTGTVAAVEAAGGAATLLSGPLEGWIAAAEPLRSFVTAHASADELAFFSDLQGLPQAHPLALVPAFLVTELTEALHMTVLIIVPFLLVDLIVAQVLVLLGLVQQPLPIVTLPLKVLLFLSVGGWDVVIGGLVMGYR